LTVFENRVLRKIFKPKRDVVTRKWSRLHKEEPHDLYTSTNVIRVIKSRRMRWAGHVARTGERRGAHSVVERKPEGKKPIVKTRHRWEDNIKLNLKSVRRAWNGFI